MRHITEKDRYFIEKSRKSNMPVAQIAKILGFSRQAIYTELKNGTVEQLESDLTVKTVYLADVGQRVHKENTKNMGRPKKIKDDDAVWNNFKYWVIDMHYSPEAFMNKTGYDTVCLSTIYNYVHRGDISDVGIENLPYARLKKKKKHKTAKRKYNKGKSIEDRPEDIEERDTVGNWEIDTVYSSKDDKTCLITMTERKTRAEIIIQTPDRTAGSIDRAVDRIERKIGAPAFRQIFKTITCDNGVEFSDWEYLQKSKFNKGRRTELYFAHPYSSWERGTNENMNRMIRRWIPKGDDIGLYSKKEIEQIADWINNYPRRMFGGLSTLEYIQTLADDEKIILKVL